MSDSIHGHQVMQMMLDHDVTFTKASLKAKMTEMFGAQARYHTCSAREMDADQLIDFLDARGKFVGEQEAFTTAADKICSHDHEHDH